MMSPTKLSLPGITIDKDKFEANDYVTFEVSSLGLDIYVKGKELSIQFPIADALNIVDTLKILMDSLCANEDEYEEEATDESPDEEYFPRGKTKQTKLS